MNDSGSGSAADKALADFDIHSAGARVGAECVWARMRDEPGLAHSDLYGGFDYVARFADVSEVLLKPAIYSSARGITIPDPEIRSYHIPTEIDPPSHREFRAVIARFLTPVAVRSREPAVRELAVKLYEGFSERDQIDYVEAFARPFPVYASLELLGFPAEDAEMLDDLVIELHNEVATGIHTGATTKLTAYVEQALVARKPLATDPDADLVSSILLGTIDGRPLTLDEQVSMVRLLMIGGFDSSAIALSTAVWWLAGHPEDAERLRDNPSLIDGFSEEVVRFASPATYLRRTVVQDAELGGTRLCPGDRLLISFGGANRDPARFDRPDEIVLDRSPNPHVGFGAGIHRCIGSFFAKLEMRVALEELLTRYRHFALDPDGRIETSAGLNQGIVALPLLLERA